MVISDYPKFIITDELSSNGTFLNGEGITPREATALKDGDKIKIGDTTLLFRQAF